MKFSCTATSSIFILTGIFKIFYAAYFSTGPEVLRDIVWSQNLDATFQSLFCNSSVDSSKVRWSYVATLSGVVRYYPASEWTVKCKRIDLYDGRSVHWFVQVSDTFHF